MDLGIKKVVDEGNGNTLIYTALLAGAIANTLPTPFDSVYFRRINKLERDFDDGTISAEKLEFHVAAEYYFWTSLWYVSLFTGVYAFGGKYKNNARILLAAVAGGLVLGAVNKNIEYDKEVQRRKEQKTTLATTNTPKEITCKNCGWSWNESDTTPIDKYICHKCGYDNTPSIIYNKTMVVVSLTAIVLGGILLYKAFKK
jgi:hypothetical protein